VSPSFLSVPVPVRTVCHTLMYVGRPQAASVQHRDAKALKVTHRSVWGVPRQPEATSVQNVDAKSLGVIRVAWRLPDERVVGKRWAGDSALTVHRGWPGGDLVAGRRLDGGGLAVESGRPAVGWGRVGGALFACRK